MTFGRVGDFKTGVSMNNDVRSVSNDTPTSDNEHIEQLRKKIGTEFTGDPKRSTGKKKNELGKDDFMKLMSAQLKYQDPITPMKNEQMAAQLAQFSALEQMLNMNNNIEKMAAGQKPSEHMLAASLIGKRVTTDTTRIMLEKGTQPEVGFNLPENAGTVTLSIFNAKGESVREIELGDMQRGPQSVRWDGKNSKAQEQPLGEYTYRVAATDTDGKAIQIKSDSSGVVTGVTFEGGKSLVLVDGKKIPIDTIGKIESDTPSATSAPVLGADGKPLPLPEGAQPEEGQKAAKAASAPAKSLTGNKQNKLSAEQSPTSPQVAKNNLPPDLSPEKIKEMLAAMGATQDSEASEASESSDAEVPEPLWNPATN
ncbi:MAG TPA: flagellar hook capping FlgD N-terminal domain-containing protein [Bdellovibrionota bacterium]|jgi:flagellar basal-body rod modification protein FlgD